MKIIEILRISIAAALVVGFGGGLWTVIKPHYSIISTVGWISGCYAVVAIVYVIRCRPGIGSAPVRIIGRNE